MLKMIAVWDSNRISPHGSKVGHTIAGPRPSAVIPLHTQIPYYELALINYNRLYQSCERLGIFCPNYINISMGEWHNTPNMLNIISTMSSRGSTIITSAGNRSQTPSELIKSQAAQSSRVLMATAIDSKGFPTLFTSYNHAAAIAVPTGRRNEMRSYDSDGKERVFGGTSAAASLTTGSFGGFTFLSDYSPGNHEGALLLEKTAIPLPFLPSTNLLGKGILNSYKIGMVALRLKQQCKDQSARSGAIRMYV